MAVETEQMSSQGVLWIVVNLHDDCGQGNTTGRLPVERSDTSIPEWGIDTAGMIDVPELMIRPTTEACGTVCLDTPAKSVKEHLSIVTCGHVDSGKRTATRRLLFELGDIPELELDKLTQETARLEKSSSALAFYMDAGSGGLFWVVLFCRRRILNRRVMFRGFLRRAGDCIDGSQLQRQATKDADYIYGMNVLRFINELTKTAITNRLDKKEDGELDFRTDLSSRYKTNRATGRQRKRWEDDINDFFKQVREEKENENPIERSNQTNRNWINIAKDCRRWALLEGNYTMTV